MLIETANECGLHVGFQWDKATLEQLKAESRLGVVFQKIVEMYNIIDRNVKLLFSFSITSH